MIRRLACLLLLLPFCGTAAQAQEPAWTIEALYRLMASSPPPPPIAYVEERWVAFVTEPIRSEGSMSFTAPDRLEKLVTLPQPERLVIAGGTVSVESPQLGSRRFALADAPLLAALANGLRSVLTGDIDATRTLFFPSIEGDRAAWRLTLLPRDATVRGVIQRVTVEGRESRLGMVELVETDGDRMVTRTRDPQP